MKKIKIAQIGVNEYSHSQEIFGSITKQNDIFEFVGYALPENEEQRLSKRASELAACKKMTVEEILSDPEIEAVAIETDEVHLTKYALMAARAGKHIHMEKPGGVSLEDFEALIGEMRKSGKVFHTGYMYRYNPYIMDIMRRVKSGEFGEVYSIDAQMNSPHPKAQREFLKSFPGGIMFFLGCHLVDLVLQIKGTPKKIT
ncbi:MAG: Gfo/Idh/MocA family oxidoreductase, partial [Oscillospiraceae bacterium]|nr:Gfo/Idh/MocA family oxidoreductase [Oscillospiraceae bacterium]